MRRVTSWRRALVALGGLASLALAPRSARGETYGFHAYPSESLPSPTIRRLFQDDAGILWLGTELGLVRYDGTSFEPVGGGGAEGVGPVDDIVEDRLGRIWELGFGGVAVVTPDGILRVTEANGLPGARPRAMVATPDGVAVTLAAPAGVALVRLPQGAPAPIVEKVDLKDAASVVYRAIHRQDDGTLLVATEADGLRVVAPSGEVTRLVGGARVLRFATHGSEVLLGTRAGLAMYGAGRIRPIAPDGPLAHAEITALLEARDGAVYAGTEDGGLARCTLDPPGTCRMLTDGTVHARVDSLAEDGGGSIWGALDAPAVLLTTPGAPRAIVVDRHHGFPYADVLDVFADRAGLLFVATASGLVRATSSGVVTYDDGDGLPGSTVWSVARLPAPSGALVVGTENGMAVFDGARARPLLTADGRPLEPALRLLPLDATTFLMGTESGLRRVRIDGDRAHVEEVGDLRGRVESIVRMRSGEIYASARTGLEALREGGVAHVAIPGLAPTDVVDHVATGEGGRLWIATSRGLFLRAEDGSTVKFGRAEGLRDDDVDIVFEAEDGTVWVGYTKNLGASALTVPRGPHVDAATIRATRVRHLSTAEGMPADSIYALAEVREGSEARPGAGVWIGTSRGLVRIARDGTMTRIGRATGMVSEDVSYGGVLVDDDGSLWVGTTRGVSHLEPSRLRPPIAPTVHLSQVALGGHAASPSARVPYADRDFSARFTSLLFQNESETTFRYRLVGYRDTWTPFTRDRAAVFANLPPGDYRLEVEARAADGTPSARPAAFPFTVVTPLYMTSWFRALLALAAAGAIVGIARMRNASLRMRNRELEARVAARTKELEKRVADLRKMNDDLAASNKRADRIFSALADALPGTVIDDKYRLEERIGSGGSGVVFRGLHVDLGRAIAVKIFKPVSGNDSAAALERFRLEGKSTARIEHPNAVRVFDFGISADGMAYMVMELLTGHPLSEEIAGGKPVAIDRAIVLVDAIASVLETAHAIGVVHRDIKPENVFLHQSPEGEVVKVVDFGIAKVMDGARNGISGMTLEGLMLGTPAYMAPERFEGDPSLVGPSSDVYALGVLAFQLLTGRLPFQGTFNEIVTGHVTSPPPRASALRPGLPAAVDAALARALAKTAEERPTIDELAAAIRRAFGRARSSAAPPNPTPPASAKRSRGAA